MLSDETVRMLTETLINEIAHRTDTESEYCFGLQRARDILNEYLNRRREVALDRR